MKTLNVTTAPIMAPTGIDTMAGDIAVGMLQDGFLMN